MFKKRDCSAKGTLTETALKEASAPESNFTMAKKSARCPRPSKCLTYDNRDQWDNYKRRREVVIQQVHSG